jgi:hypothetical protein
MPVFSICSFKDCCKKCKIVEKAERPLGCRDLHCPDYTPCKSCGNNKDIGTNDLCAECNGGDLEFGKSVVQEIAAPGPATIETEEDIAVTIPGEPPSSFSDSQKAYYAKRWKEFDGYYRDPAAYAAVHYMILEELNLDNIHRQLVLSRNNINQHDKWAKAKDSAIETLQKLKKQLPEKEALDENEEEKALACIYDDWTKEMAASTRYRVRRLVTTEAIALAPALPFSINVRVMLEKLGFNLIEIEDVLDRYIVPETNKTPDQILELLGFKLKEEYAIPDKKDNKEGI